MVGLAFRGERLHGPRGASWLHLMRCTQEASMHCCNPSSPHAARSSMAPSMACIACIRRVIPPWLLPQVLMLTCISTR